MTNTDNWLPPVTHTSEGHERRVGIEVELAGIEPVAAADCIRRLFGGELEEKNRFEYKVTATEFGEFVVELDASYLKALGEKLYQDAAIADEASLESLATDLLTKTAEQIVPWEIVAPPIPVSQLSRLQELIVALREAGALGTRYTLRYAFGIHLNPELPQLDVATILRYFRAFLCLYDWIVEQERIDFARKLTTYIKHFSKDYILRVIDPSYTPSLSGLIDDYLWANRTRNRSMDLLPLFSYMDEKRVRAQLDDPRIKSRPTLHYRLPNCDIDNPRWSLYNPWDEWLQVERLANEPERLSAMCRDYGGYLRNMVPSLENEWVKQTRQWLGR